MAQLKDVLGRAVQLSTDGRAAAARPSQLALAELLLTNMEDGRHAAAEAMTGTGKSLAYLAPAAMRAALYEERTLISTETLALQSQLYDKDAPATVQAASELLGVPAPQVAVLKGWSNTVCSMAAVAAASDLTTLPSKDPEALLDALEGAVGETTDLVRWSLREVVASGTGDKADYDRTIAGEDWNLVSTTPAECPGVSNCPFGHICLPHAAKMRAAGADIVITNHSMLAVQAATGAPVVVGAKSLGPFHHLVVDEAHGLASAVRSQGAATVSPRRIADAIRVIERLLDKPAAAKELRDEATALAGRLDRRLVGLLEHARSTGSQIARIGADDDPFDGLAALLKDWVLRASRLIPRPRGTQTPRGMRDRLRAIARMDALSQDISAAQYGENDMARWVERSERTSGSEQRFSGACIKVAPVDVSRMLRAYLYEAPQQDGWTDKPEKEVSVGPDDAPDQIEVVDEKVHMSIAVLSATLPQSFVVELGVDARRAEYPSPFADAYDRSLLFIPSATAAELGKPGGKRTTFNIERHPEWAAKIVCDLVVANRGSALVLAATTAAGQLYADRLRRSRNRLHVISQWDGQPIRKLIAAWREDHQSVLVGTRSLMTGVDAPGATCSLVIVDRCPRAAGNPVDDARAEHLVKRLSIDKWAADRMVYVSDAALLLEQAAGRLIRSQSDQGVVAVLDPRLLPPRLGDFHYQEPTRNAYLDALGQFPHRTSGEEKVLVYLREQCAAQRPRRSRRKAA